jgi:tRNA (Thr-GGU) A37 N-methylase
VVQLLTIEGTKLKVKGVDVLDQTPLLDIKPYVPEFDVRTVVKTGWFETRSKK